MKPFITLLVLLSGTLAAHAQTPAQPGTTPIENPIQPGAQAPAVPAVPSAPNPGSSPIVNPEASAIPKPQPRTFNIAEEINKLRDPFRRADLSKYISKSRLKGELEQFATSEYKMKGVITGAKRVRAMVEAPNGKTYFVKINDKIGLQNGVVTKITPDRILVTEKTLNLMGEEEIIQNEITLPGESDKIDIITSSPSSGESEAGPEPMPLPAPGQPPEMLQPGNLESAQPLPGAVPQPQEPGT